MRQPRLKLPDQPAVYHCTSRCVGKQFLLADPDKEILRQMLWQQADFCGVQIITYSVLDNHFHVAARIPEPIEVSDLELLRRIESFYPADKPLRRQLRRTFDQEGGLPEKLRQCLLRRMGDISWFMKELKQRFSREYNKRHERIGTLWAERFGSVLVEDNTEAVTTLALYIDLNPVRANLVSDPKDYRFCGYAEAVAGNPLAQGGLQIALGGKDWEEGGAHQYRKTLFVRGAEPGASGGAVLLRAAILAVLLAGGKISPAEALRLRVRYFTHGLVLGSVGFVNGVFERFRERFGKRRRTGARRLRRLPFEELRVMRDLRVDVVS